MKYQLLDDHTILDTENMRYIPKSLRNRHYSEFLRWLEAGNTPDPVPSGRAK
jgi:hypothetical protein